MVSLAVQKLLSQKDIQSHINRKKAAWKNPLPPPEVINTWVSHKLASQIYTLILRLPLKDLVKMHKSLLKDSIKGLRVSKHSPKVSLVKHKAFKENHNVK
jgi:hypothetical protein